MSPSEMLFQHRSRVVRRGELRAFWQGLVAAMKAAPANCLVTTDEELRRLNKQFRKKDSATDVLSFPGVPGEIAISLDRAAEQAAGMGHSVDEELRILMLHGLLHLSGMDHETDSGEMAKAEARWRKKLKLPVGLIERAHA
ncbi:MAG: rRNA maturation RNase YbeY [Bryobacteraceae bacterium]